MEPFNAGFGLEIADGEVEGLRESTDCRLQAAGSEVFRSLVVSHGGDFGKSENGRRKAELCGRWKIGDRGRIGIKMTLS